MDHKIFIPSTRGPSIISDCSIMDKIINLYLDKQFSEMKGFILEYGEADFFNDLSVYFKNGYWRNPLNQYHIFAGITIAFFRIYT